MMRRLQCNKPVLRCLQAKLKSLERHHKYEEFRTILGQLGSGTHPSAEDLIAVKDIFAEGPYSLLGMTRKHVVCNAPTWKNTVFLLLYLLPCRNPYSRCMACRIACLSDIDCTSTHSWCTTWTCASRARAECIIWAWRRYATHVIYADWILTIWALRTWSNGYAHGLRYLRRYKASISLSFYIYLYCLAITIPTTGGRSTASQQIDASW